jgi:hypothetical protein
MASILATAGTIYVDNSSNSIHIRNNGNATAANNLARVATAGKRDK